MVEKEASIYLFAGEDSQAKTLSLNKLKDNLLSSKTRDFNLDVLYARELGLKLFQEKVLMLPVRSRKRVIIIKQAEHLKEEVRKYILDNLTVLKPRIVLILDADVSDRKNAFLSRISKLAQVFTFGASVNIDTFTLNRQIESKKADAALRTLGQLLSDGERPERIMGGLRYAWEKDVVDSAELKKRLNILLNCDLDIKRGRLRPDFALEKLIIALCAFGKAKGKS